MFWDGWLSGFFELFLYLATPSFGKAHKYSNIPNISLANLFLSEFYWCHSVQFIAYIVTFLWNIPYWKQYLNIHKILVDQSRLSSLIERLLSALNIVHIFALYYIIYKKRWFFQYYFEHLLLNSYPDHTVLIFLKIINIGWYSLQLWQYGA